MRQTKSALVMFVAGVLLGANPAKAPDISINVANQHLTPGQNSYYSVVVDSRDLSDHIKAASQQTSLPPVINTPMTHDIFSSGEDTSGFYQSGFWNGWNVWSLNLIDNVTGTSQTGIPSSPLGPVGNYDEVIRFYFEINQNAQIGSTHYITLDSGSTTLTANNGSGSFGIDATAQQNPEARNYFTIIPPCLPNGPTTPEDRDDDGDVDLTDFQTFQYYMLGPGTPSNCGGDFDGDGDSDIRDYALFQQAYTG